MPRLLLLDGEAAQATVALSATAATAFLTTEETVAPYATAATAPQKIPKLRHP